MSRGIDRLEAERSRVLTRFNNQHGYAAEGFGSAVAWLRVHGRMSAADAMQRVELGRRLPSLEGAEKAFLQGDIGFRNATVLARAVAETGPDHIAPVASMLVELARTQDPHRLRICTRHARHCSDPDGALADAERDHQHRWLSLSQTIDGIFALDGTLDAESGTLLRTALDALSKPARNDDRSAGQRRADALVELAQRQLQSGTVPTCAGRRPHLVLTVPVATLRGEADAPAAELDRGWPVHPDSARRLACDAAVTRITIEAATSEPLSVGRTRRTVPASMRRALAARDRGCRFPGCDRPVEWTDAHHVVHWADHGETALPNLVLLCRPCHRRVHEGRWRLSLDRAGAVTAVPP